MSDRSVFPELHSLKLSTVGRRRRPVLAGSLFAGSFLALAAAAAAQQGNISMSFPGEQRKAAAGPGVVVVGTVFEDVDGDGRFSAGVDMPVGGAGVSDGESVTVSDGQGRYVLRSSVPGGMVFLTQPAGFARRNDFFALLPAPSVATTTATESEPSRRAPRLGVDFPLTRAPQPDPVDVRFVQAADPALRGEQDRKLFAEAVGEINALAPAASFVVSTGHLVEGPGGAEAWKVYAEESGRSALPWFHVAAGGSAEARHLAPAWYSADLGGLHLLFLGGTADADLPRRGAWLERDVSMLGRGKTVVALLADAPDHGTLDRLRKLGVKGIFYGGTFSNQSLGLKDGTAIIGQSPLLMGGLDGSPASFRIVSTSGKQMMSEFRVRAPERLLKFPYPQRDLAGPERVMANIYDTVGDVAEARFRVAAPEGVVGEGAMKKVGPFTWMGSLDPKEFGIRKLPPQFVVAVRARGEGGASWENGGPVVVPQSRRERPAKVTPGSGWMQFMGNAQHTGRADDDVTPPLRLVWATPTHGHIDVSSPVYYKGTVAIGVKDRDNLINNGVAIFSAGSGELTHFSKTDAMVCGTPAFAEDKADGPGRIYAISGAASVFNMSPVTGQVEGTGGWKEKGPGWVWGSPVAQGRLAVAGGPGGMMALLAWGGEQRWISTFGSPGLPSFASPSLAGEQLIMGGNGLKAGGRDASIYALDARSGQAKWANPTAGILGSVAVQSGKGYAIDTAGWLKVLDLNGGADAGQVDLGGGQSLSTPAVDRNLIIAPTATGTVRAFDRESLQPVWTFRAGRSLWKMAPLDRENKAVFSSPTISGAFVYIGCSDGHLYALDKATGQAVWSYDFGVPTLSTPCVTGNSLFTAACDGNVYAFTRAQ